MIKTPSSTAIGGTGIWTPNCAIIGGQSKAFGDADIQKLFSGGKESGGAQGLFYNVSRQIDATQMTDLSGNNNHGIQVNSTSRAILVSNPSGYKSLMFDGVDDSYATQNVNLKHTQNITIIAAIRKLSDITYRVIIEHSALISNAGAFTLQTGYDASEYGFRVNAGGIINARTDSYVAPHTAVLTGVVNNLQNGVSNISLNGVKSIDNTLNASLTVFGNAPFYIGRRGGSSNPFNGQIYALLIIDRLLTTKETQSIEKYFSKLVGVSI